MEDTQKKLQKFLTVVVNVVELEVTFENLIFVEFVLEKKLMLENYQVLENQVGNKKIIISLIINFNIMIIDPIGDLLTRVRNAYMARLEEMTVPYSKIKSDILRILKKNKYIIDFETVEENGFKFIKVTLNNLKITKYLPNFKRISKPGQRIYVGSTDIKKSKNGKGIFIVSTPK
jgi:small subunit ribosomal protein S8